MLTFVIFKRVETFVTSVSPREAHVMRKFMAEMLLFLLEGFHQLCHCHTDRNNTTTTNSDDNEVGSLEEKEGGGGGEGGEGKGERRGEGRGEEGGVGVVTYQATRLEPSAVRSSGFSPSADTSSNSNLLCLQFSIYHVQFPISSFHLQMS